MKKDRLSFKKALIFLCAAIFMAGLIASPASSGQWSEIGEMEDEVRALAMDSAGNLYAGGEFDEADGTSAYYIAKRNTDGTWVNIGDLNDRVRTIAFDSDDNMYIGGYFTTVNSITMQYIAKRNADGTWENIGDFDDYEVRALAFDSAGDLYVGGDFDSVTTTSGTTSATGIIKLNTATGVWENIGDMDDQVVALAFDSAGNLYAGGDFTTAGGVDADYIAKMNTSGGWENIGDMDTYPVRALAIDSNDILYAGGDFEVAGTIGAWYIGKFDTTTGIWSNIGDMDDYVRALAIDSEDNLYAGGDFDYVDAMPASYIAKYDPNAGTWSNIGHMEDYVRALVFGSDGYLYAGGEFDNADGVEAYYIAKWTPAEIDLNQDGTPIADGGSYDFGDQDAGSDTDVIFTIENTSTSAYLTLTTPLTIAGANLDEFSIVTQPAATVAPGETTTFTVRFSPASTGVKTAMISIDNNDVTGDENPYVLNLNGAGPDPVDPVIIPSPIPSVLNVTSTAVADSYSAGSVIVFTVHFSELVWVTGEPLLVLNTGGSVPGTALYSGGSGTDMLTFRYTVADGDDISALDYWSEWALELNGGRIYSNYDIEADLGMAGPGQEGSVGYNTDAGIFGVFGVMYPVYRFYSAGLSKHLFTIDEIEKTHLIEKVSEVWQFEKIAFYAYPTQEYEKASRQHKSALRAVHRFYSEALQTHLFTIDENEKEYLIADAADVWRYEGPAFYVPVDSQEETLPVYRFYSENLKVHLFTINEKEKYHLIHTASDVWRYEGIAYYAYP